jgi:hypothetical protein
MSQRSASRAGVFPALALGLCAVTATVSCSEDGADVRYDPSPPAVVERMLELGDADAADILYDLGSGDGRIVIAAARDFGVERAIGVEIDPELIERSRENAREAGVADRTRFVRADLFEYDFSDADTVTLFLLPELNIRLRPRLLSELEPGTRVVSHEHRMGDWEPDRTVRVDGHFVHRWIIPARFGGEWRWEADGTRYVLTLRQRYQRITGTLSAGDVRAVLEPASVRGRALSFTALPGGDEGGTAFEFAGRLEDGRLQGTLRHGEQRIDVRARGGE